ncbi:hypothetical protein L3Q72_13910 [Vibrio sp. JC009]|uniref:hypothetical protein n=1 Tax=Vibrio sp. JC009 TaxID=2912314 RepID=UPI0023B08280|nr:hypothetical protein [Vibrio sp. JC009]WED21689.1 hypothetical protein L3Q72_13910 [Vibrio sp. JC009]
MSSDQSNKPKGMHELVKQEDFSQYLQRRGKELKEQQQSNTQLAPKTAQPQPSRPVKINPETNAPKAEFSQKTVDRLFEFTQEQQVKIHRLWHEMIDLFSKSKIRQEFGDEPDMRFMMFAAELTKDQYQRLMDNIYERLSSGNEWPPAMKLLEMFTDTPTKAEIIKARQHLLVEKKPTNRVERFIDKRRTNAIRNLSERYLETEFASLYREAFTEVMINNLDVILDETESTVQTNIRHIPETSIDKQRNEFDLSTLKNLGTVGKHLDRILKEVKQHPTAEEVTVEEVSREEQIRLEQERLAQQILDDNSDK